jgi:hypothetical protein
MAGGGGGDANSPGGGANSAGSSGYTVYQAGASGNLGSLASAYVALSNFMGTSVSSTDTYLAALIIDASWNGQVSGVSASLLPTGGFQISGTTQNGNALTNYQVGSDFVSSYLSNLDGYTGVPNAGGESGLKIASQVFETTAISYETTVQGVEGAVALSNKISGTALQGVELGSKGLSVGLGIVSAGFTVANAAQNGWQNHHTADLLVTAAETGLALFEATNPIGWGLALGMFIGNMVSEHYTGKSITQNLFDN